MSLNEINEKRFRKIAKMFIDKMAIISREVSEIAKILNEEFPLDKMSEDEILKVVKIMLEEINKSNFNNKQKAYLTMMFNRAFAQPMKKPEYVT